MLIMTVSPTKQFAQSKFLYGWLAGSLWKRHSYMTPRPYMPPQLPQPSHGFPVLVLGTFTMVIDKQSRKTRGGEDNCGDWVDAVMLVGISTFRFLENSTFEVGFFCFCYFYILIIMFLYFKVDDFQWLQTKYLSICTHDTDLSQYVRPCIPTAGRCSLLSKRLLTPGLHYH